MPTRCVVRGTARQLSSLRNWHKISHRTSALHRAPPARIKFFPTIWQRGGVVVPPPLSSPIQWYPMHECVLGLSHRQILEITKSRFDNWPIHVEMARNKKNGAQSMYRTVINSVLAVTINKIAYEYMLNDW